VAALAACGYVGNRAVAAASDAADRFDYRAAEVDARTVRRWAFWSADGWRLLGEAQAAEGNVDAARRTLQRGLERDDRDWELWLDLALASEGSARRHALHEAARLNPLDPELAALRTGGAEGTNLRALYQQTR
jgi:Flp pilus assembly protein TadD